MSLNSTPSGDRTHIAFFGMRNAGKSSLVNAVTGQDLAVVSDVEGTTTDPVRKAMELLPVGPVLIIDTPGIDDEGKLGEMRVERTRRTLRSCDVAVLVAVAGRALTPAEEELVELFEQRDIPFVIARNKADLLPDDASCNASGDATGAQRENEICISALRGTGIHELKELIAHVAQQAQNDKRLLADLFSPGDMVVLVVPIDSSAPKGRLILPQQMVLRDVLDAHAACAVCQPDELAGVLDALASPPRIVITDSQAFAEVAAIVPRDVPLTSFSILMARYKGSLEPFARGTEALSRLRDGDRVLISEGCTHHRQCEDIGTVKLPAWIRSFSGADPAFEFTSGGEFPDEVSGFALVVHCGACMLNEREMRHRMRAAEASGVPIVNYGMAIACMHGILERALEPFELHGEAHED